MIFLATPAAVPAANVVNNLQRQAGAYGGFEQKALFPGLSNGGGWQAPVIAFPTGSFRVIEKRLRRAKSEVGAQKHPAGRYSLQRI